VSPIQSSVLPEIETEGAGFTVTVPKAVSAQLPADTITEYVVVVPGETLIDAEEFPVLHEYAAPPDAESVAFCPEQIVELETAATGGGETVTVADVVPVQLPLVATTE
jgi:hypothetical protein